MREQRVQRLIECGLVPIIRAPRREDVVPAARALAEGGVKVVEITLTTPGALEAIEETRRVLGSEILVGAGSVIHAADCRDATASGAEFIVSPICRPELVGPAHEAGCPAMLGAYTPTEAQLAHEAGSDFVKLFPAEGLGPGYIKSLRAPLPHLRIVPTGGVNLQTLAAFFQAGCPAVGVGSALVSKDILARGDWTELARRARQFVEAVRQARGC